jgi:transcription antitermination factor NusG
MGGQVKDWCILRTSGRNTIPLVETLKADGFTAWTPVEVQRIRKRNSHERLTRAFPMTPSFVFARADRIAGLLALSNAYRKRQPDFSVMRYRGNIPTIADLELEALRSMELRAQPKEDRPKFGVGSTVRVPEGAFAGMTGIVETDDGKFALVGFGGRMKVRVASFLLRPSEKEAA